MLDSVQMAGWQAHASEAAAALAFGYLLGSIPFGLIFGLLAGAGDVRKIGSGSIGATNVLRTGKYWAAAATVICDAAKGAAAVLLVRRFGMELAVIAGIGAFLGHLFPVWLKFRGGKGVATAGGVVLALSWPIALMGFVTWLVVAVISRISSLSALVAAVATPIYFVLFAERPYALAALVLAVLIFISHRANIARLIRGEEPRIGRSVAAP
jgi:acyl phosphate:glycerol-3-phosphate acyltransferase